MRKSHWIISPNFRDEKKSKKSLSYHHPGTFWSSNPSWTTGPSAPQRSPCPKTQSMALKVSSSNTTPDPSVLVESVLKYRATAGIKWKRTRSSMHVAFTYRCRRICILCLCMYLSISICLCKCRFTHISICTIENCIGILRLYVYILESSEKKKVH